jgi:atypical dual specificity phosphatase
MGRMSVLTGFNWIIPGELAGSAQPGMLTELSDDIDFLRTCNIVRIVTLTSGPLPASVAEAGFELIHFPIMDMGIPTPRACAGLCVALVEDLHARPVLLHCRGGLGRTGTIAACCLVTLGQSPDQALAHVRGINPNYVQTGAQSQFIHHYQRYLVAR